MYIDRSSCECIGQFLLTLKSQSIHSESSAALISRNTGLEGTGERGGVLEEGEG